MMNLYVIRHADAGNPNEWSGNDADRPLSPLGQQHARALGEAFRHQGIALDAVVASPFARTRETAEGLLGAWPGGAGPQFCDLLAPGELRRRKLTKFLANLALGSIAIVGHDPDVASYLGWLLGVDPEKVQMKKGAAAFVRFQEELEKGEGALAWLVAPEWYLPIG